jgi:carnitine O-acetyltransferase
MLSATRLIARRTPLKRRTMSTSTVVLPPNPRPKHWKTLAPAAPAGTKTYGAQASLPRLPVPALADTLQRLKQSIEPLSHSKDEYASAIQKIDSFAKSDLAQTLQTRLEDRAKETPHWLEQWWDDGAYLGYRDSVRAL